MTVHLTKRRCDRCNFCEKDDHSDLQIKWRCIVERNELAIGPPKTRMLPSTEAGSTTVLCWLLNALHNLCKVATLEVHQFLK